MSERVNIQVGFLTGLPTRAQALKFWAVTRSAAHKPSGRSSGGRAGGRGLGPVGRAPKALAWAWPERGEAGRRQARARAGGADG